MSGIAYLIWLYVGTIFFDLSLLERLKIEWPVQNVNQAGTPKTALQMQGLRLSIHY
jgi:hypothetical protein